MRVAAAGSAFLWLLVAVCQWSLRVGLGRTRQCCVRCFVSPGVHFVHHLRDFCCDSLLVTLVPHWRRSLKLCKCLMVSFVLRQFILLDTVTEAVCAVHKAYLVEACLVSSCCSSCAYAIGISKGRGDDDDDDDEVAPSSYLIPDWLCMCTGVSAHVTTGQSRPSGGGGMTPGTSVHRASPTHQ